VAAVYQFAVDVSGPFGWHGLAEAQAEALTADELLTRSEQIQPTVRALADGIASALRDELGAYVELDGKNAMTLGGSPHEFMRTWPPEPRPLPAPCPDGSAILFVALATPPAVAASVQVIRAVWRALAKRHRRVVRLTIVTRDGTRLDLEAQDADRISARIVEAGESEGEEAASPE